MGNPQYYPDLDLMEVAQWDLGEILRPSTVFVVVGSTILSELFDRDAAERLRDELNRRRSYESTGKSIILCDRIWEEEGWLHDYRSVFVGGPMSNRATAVLIDSADWEENTVDLGSDSLVCVEVAEPVVRFFLWGEGAEETREAVERFVGAPGLMDTLG